MIKLLKSLKPYIPQILIIVGLVFIQTIADLKLPDIMSNIVDTGVVNSDIPYIYKMGGTMLIYTLIATICSIIAGLFSARVASGFSRDTRNKLFKHVESFSTNEFNTIGTSSLMTRTTNDVSQVQMAIFLTLRLVLSAPIMCVGGVIMALQKDTSLSSLLLIVIPAIGVAIFFVARSVIPIFQKIQVKLDNLSRVFRERLVGFRVIRAYNRQDYEDKRFDVSNRDLTDTTIKVNRIMAVLMPLMNLFFSLMAIAITWFGAKRVDAGTLQVGNMMAFIQYAMQILMSLVMVSIIFVMLPRAAVSANRINEVLDIEPTIEDPKEKKVPTNLMGDIDFRNVTFSYPGAEKPVLYDISFSAKQGETIAIIGGTGSGKSTLVNLIMRFYDVQEGGVIVDGIDIREMDQDVLRSRIGYVPQKSVLFSGSIKDNIRYGKEDATDDDIIEAAKTAQAYDFIMEKEDGFDSMIAQGGANVSGGQKQRLSIARALVRKAEIYIFDDSFSALDFKTDSNLRGAIKKDLSDATVVIVAQRVSTIMDADRILVLDEGRLVGTGSHEHLMKECDVYKEIVLSQLSEEEI